MAAALLITLSENANAADDDSEHQSQNAQKILTTLNMVGINSKEVKDFVAETNSRVDNDHSYQITGDSFASGQWSLRYDPSMAIPNGRQLELRYTPDDSHVNIVVKTNMAVVGYHFKFE